MILFTALLLLAGAALFWAWRSDRMWRAVERFVERTFLFYPSARWDMTPADLGIPFENLLLETADGTAVSAWHVPAEDPEAPVLLFCHGNAGNISHRVHNLSLLHELGLSVLIFDYPGYGRSGGSPSEEGMYRAAHAAYDHLEGELGVPDGRLVIFGRSIGSAPAVELASGGRGGALILECAFGSLLEMARRHYPIFPVPGPLRRKLPTRERLSRVGLPLLSVHGDRDRIVPLEMGMRLYEAAPGPKEFYRIEGAGHNDTVAVGGAEYRRRLRAFVDRWIK